jgi:hypothetical protein
VIGSAALCHEETSRNPRAAVRLESKTTALSRRADAVSIVIAMSGLDASLTLCMTPSVRIMNIFAKGGQFSKRISSGPQ